MVKKKLSLILLIGIFFILSFSSVVFAESFMNDSVKLELEENVTVQLDKVPMIEENVTEDTNETFEENETMENRTNITILDNSSLDKNITFPEDSILEINQTNNSVENITEELTILENLFLTLNSLANSSSYGLNLFALGLQAGKTIWEGHYLTYFLSFNDGMTGDANSISYTVNVGPLSRYTNYEQCFRNTCSGLGYNCGSWDDGCGGPNLTCGTCGTNYECYSGICTLDEDNDTIADDEDNLIGDCGDCVNQEGCSNLRVKVNNSEDLSGNVTGCNCIEIYDGSDLILNATHNFSAGKVYLRKITMIKGTNYIIANLSNQLLSTETKTVYIDDNNFIGICVEDSEISSISEISSDCSGANEYDLTGCLGNSTGYTNGTITCYDEGSRIRVENLTHSAIRGTVASSSPSSSYSSSGGSSSCTYDKNYDWECSEWSECIRGIQTRECKEKNNCGNNYGRPETERDCSSEIPEQLFDITWNLDDKTISNSSELVGVVTFENFGTESTFVDLTFIILDSYGNEVYHKKGDITVTTEEVMRWEFIENGLNELPLGKYTAVLETLYNENVLDKFEQNFEVREKSFNMLYLILGIILFFVVFFLILKVIIKLRRPKPPRIKEYSKWKKEQEKKLLNKDLRKMREVKIKSHKALFSWIKEILRKIERRLR